APLRFPVSSSVPFVPLRDHFIRRLVPIPGEIRQTVREGGSHVVRIRTPHVSSRHVIPRLFEETVLTTLLLRLVLATREVLLRGLGVLHTSRRLQSLYRPFDPKRLQTCRCVTKAIRVPSVELLYHEFIVGQIR